MKTRQNQGATHREACERAGHTVGPIEGTGGQCFYTVGNERKGPYYQALARESRNGELVYQATLEFSGDERIATRAWDTFHSRPPTIGKLDWRKYVPGPAKVAKWKGELEA